MQLLRQRRPWDEAGTASVDPTAAASRPGWRLAGVIERDGVRLALIAAGEDPAAALDYLATGAKLPDGTTIVRIDTDGITVASNDPVAGQRDYRLFAKR